METLRAHAEEDPGAEAFRFTADGRAVSAKLTRADLAARAGRVVAALTEAGIGTGERVLLVCGPGPDFVAGFLGCLYAGVCAVPCSPPASSSRRQRLLGVLADADATAVISQRDLWTDPVPGAERLPVIYMDDLPVPAANAPRLPSTTPGPDALAVLQYTSGSTSAPKGVMVTHGNLAANMMMIHNAIGANLIDEPLSIVTWLPVYHDMGLMGALLSPLYLGGRVVMMPPEAFLRDPVVWLRQISAFDGPVSSPVPNFALDLAVNQITPQDMDGIRLDNWHSLICGSEPVRAASLNRFRDRFADAGFRASSLCPAYGLAEGTLLVTAAYGVPATLRADAAALEAGRLIPAAADARAVDIVSCGPPPPGSRVAIVDPATAVNADPGEVGEIWIAGDNVTPGYWKAADPDAGFGELDGERWFRTGDLGVLLDGGLHITGRSKDLIIVNGRNLYPHDIEATAGSTSPTSRPGRAAAFSAPGDEGDEGNASERLIVMRAVDPSVKRGDEEALAALADSVRRAVLSEHEAEPDEVVLVRAPEIKLTTSGKVRRGECRRRYAAGEVRPLHVLRRDATLGRDGAPAPRQAAPGQAAPGQAAPRQAAPSRQALRALAPQARRGAVEAWLRGVTADLARVPAWEIDPGVPLPALGLDSLRIAKVQSLIADALRVTPPPQAETLNDIIDAITEGLETEAGPAQTPVPVAADQSGPFPLTDLQYAYLIGRGDSHEFGGVAAHAYLELEAESVDPARLKSAWRKLTERHDMLRMVVTDDGRQRILSEVPDTDFQITDLTELDPQERQERLTATRDEHDHAVPTPHEWPLHRVIVSLLPENKARVHLSIDLLTTDLHSLRVLSEEWRLLYGDADADLPKLELGFRDIVLAGHAAEPAPESVTYWTERLPGLPGGPDLPSRRETADNSNKRFARRQHRLDPETWAAIRAQARSRGITPAVTLLAAYSATLATWSRTQRFCVNVTQFNRPPSPAQAEGIVGDFTSVSPLEVDTAPAGTFAGFAVAVQRRLRADLEHRDFSGVRVLRELARLHGAARKAILPVVFTSGLGADDPRLPFTWLGELGFGISQTPQVLLDHQAFEDGEEAVLVWDAVAGAFPEPMLDDMFAAYTDLLRGLAGDRGWDGPPRAGLPARQAAERDSANATAGALPDGTLEAPVFARAAERPDAIAVIAPDRQLSYRDLTGRAAVLAARLLAGGVARGDVVAVNLAKGWRQVVAVLAVTRAGACYLPVDPDLPAGRQEHLTAHAGAVCVLAGEDGPAWPTTLPSYPVSPADPSDPTLDPERRSAPADVAYIIYTSGSTGTPKGVAVSHRAALNTCDDIARRFAIGPDDRVLGLSQLSFDLSVFDIFGVLGAGGSLILPEAEHRGDPAHWLDLIRRHRPTVWNSAPVLMDLLAGHAETLADTEPLPLRLVLLSGDWIPVSLPGRVRAAAPEARVISLGGATEAAVWSIWHPVAPGDASRESVPYGRPLRGQSFQVLNGRLEPCPEWVAGELFIGGAGLAEGYWRDPGRTAASFIAHPVSGERLYRTGDLGRYLPGGVIQFLGREDDQVKIGGYRIELGEIEHALRDDPAVAEATVIVHGDRHQRRLAAFVTPASTGPSAPGASEASLAGDDLDGIITDPVDRAEFKLRRPALRRFGDRSAVALPEVPAGARAPSCRRFAEDPVPLNQLAQMIGALRNTGDSHGYGSAGGLYPVQAYLDVARVEGLPPGAYYYDPDAHRLVPLETAAPPRPGMADVNAGLAREAAFAIYLVAEHDAIRPLYGSLSRDFTLIEAGLIAQALETEAARAGLGLCQVGGLRHDAAVTARFELGDSHEPLHALVGGRPASLDRPRDTVRERLARRLPAYMVPGVIRVMDRLPMTPNGKVDRRALEAIAASAASENTATAAPATDTERVIVELLAEVLGADPASIGTGDGFFDLGADSEALTRVYTRLLARLDVTFPLLALFEAPNARDLARRIDGDHDSRAAASEGRNRAAQRLTAQRSAAQRRRQNQRPERNTSTDEH